MITVFIDFFKYVFDISFEEFFENLKAYFLGEETVERDDTPLITTTLLDDREVFNVSNNLYTYEDAKAVCKAMDAELATYKLKRLIIMVLNGVIMAGQMDKWHFFLHKKQLGKNYKN